MLSGAGGDDLYTMGSDGTNPQLVFESGAFVGAPAWRPGSVDTYAAGGLGWEGEAAQARARSVVFRDPDLEGAVRQAAGLPPGTPLTVDDLTPVRELRVEESQIGDLSGIDGLSRLEKLFAAHNQIEDLNPLSGLEVLWVLDLTGNRVSARWPACGPCGVSTCRTTRWRTCRPLAG